MNITLSIMVRFGKVKVRFAQSGYEKAPDGIEIEKNGKTQENTIIYQ